METITTFFIWLGTYIPAYFAILAVAGVILAVRKNYIGGGLVFIGSSLYLLGYIVNTYLNFDIGYSPFSELLTTLTHPGLALIALGLLHVAFTYQKAEQST